MTQHASAVAYAAFRPYPFGGGSNLAFGLSLNRSSKLSSAHLVVTKGHSPDWGFLGARGISIHELECVQPGLGASVVSYLRGYREIVDAVDVVDVAEVTNSLSAQITCYAKRKGKRTIATVIETCADRVLDKLPPWSCYSSAVKSRADRFRVLTNRSKDYLAGLGVSDDKIDLIPIGVDRTLFHPGERPRGDDSLRILFARRLERKNGFLDLLRASPDLAQVRPPPEIWIAGTGPLRASVEHATKYLRVRFLGPLRYDELASAYRQVDVYCNLGTDTTLMGRTVQEDGQYTFPLLEAQASGLPVITTRSGSNSELLAPGNFQIPQGDISALADAVRRLTDHDERTSIGKGNVDFVRSMFDAERLQPKMDEMVQSLASTTSGASK